MHGWQICQERDARDNGFASNALPAKTSAWLAAEQATTTLIVSQSRRLERASKCIWVNISPRPHPNILLTVTEIQAIDQLRCYAASRMVTKNC